MIKALLISSLAMNLGLLLGRLSGFVREAFVASTYGASSQADIVVLMLTVPDLLVNILVGGAMGAMLVPEFTQRPKVAAQLLYQSLLFFGMLFLMVTMVLYWRVDALVALLVPGFSDSQAEYAANGLGWVLWLIPLTILSGVVTAYLHAQHRFAVAAMGTLIINCTIIAGLVLVYYGYGALSLIALFVIIGGLIRLLSQLSLVPLRWSPFTSLNPWRLHRPLLVRYGQAMMSGSVLLLFPVVARALASYESEGSVAMFNYSMRLIEFPLAIAVTFLAVIFFPRLAQSFTSDARQHRQLIRYGVQMTLVLSLVSSIMLVYLSDAYAELVYGHGDMDGASVITVATLAAIGLLMLPFQGLSMFLTAVFNARNDMRTPLLINGSGLVFFLIASSAGLFGNGLSALMWGMVVSYALICALQLIALKIDSLKWLDVLFEKTFFIGIICAVFIIVLASNWIQQMELSAWLSFVLACFFALVSLVVATLFNNQIRLKLKFWLMNK